MQGVFVTKYDPTVEDSYRKQVEVDDENLVVELYDTAGQEDYAALRNLYIESANGFLLVFSLTQRSTFTACAELHDMICKIKGTAVPPVVLVGNKKDMHRATNITPKNIAVFCTERNCTYIEVSAKTGDNVNQAFIDLIRLMRKQNRRKPKPTAQRRCVLF